MKNSLRGLFFHRRLSLVAVLFFLGGGLLIASDQSFANPALPGGEGTSGDLSRNAFNHILRGAERGAKNQFFVGNSFFKQAWVQAPSSTIGRDGLGPTFNATSCTSCHSFDGRGQAYSSETETHLSLLFRLNTWDGQQFGDHPVYGGQINHFGIEAGLGEGPVSVVFEKVQGSFADGTEYELRKPLFSFEQLFFGSLGPDTFISPRVANQMVGLGLIENISATDILAWEDEQDHNEDGVSGRAQWTTDIVTGQRQLGRFGWRAEQPSLRQQNAAAFLGDVGITSSLFPEENCPAPQTECGQTPSGGAPELEERVLDRVTTYTQLLSVPRRRSIDDPEVLRGERVFWEVSCHSCHRPSYTTSSSSPYAILNHQEIYPYSDFLLHDMGPELADITSPGTTQSDEVQAQDSREWRTAPLWGIGLIETVNDHLHLLHDGRARGVQEAILWHGGEAENSREEFKRLTRQDREALVKFVMSL